MYGVNTFIWVDSFENKKAYFCYPSSPQKSGIFTWQWLIVTKPESLRYHFQCPLKLLDSIHYQAKNTPHCMQPSPLSSRKVIHLLNKREASSTLSIVNPQRFELTRKVELQPSWSGIKAIQRHHIRTTQWFQVPLRINWSSEFFVKNQISTLTISYKS